MYGWFQDGVLSGLRRPRRFWVVSGRRNVWLISGGCTLWIEET